MEPKPWAHSDQQLFRNFKSAYDKMISKYVVLLFKFLISLIHEEKTQSSFNFLFVLHK